MPISDPKPDPTSNPNSNPIPTTRNQLVLIFLRRPTRALFENMLEMPRWLPQWSNSYNPYVFVGISLVLGPDSDFPNFIGQSFQICSKNPKIHTICWWKTLS